MRCGWVANSIGGAIGSSVAGAVWGGTFTSDLARWLPEETRVNATIIAADITTQLSYPLGDPTRIGIQNAYGNSQRLMLITSICMLSLGLICTIFIRDINLKHNKQVVGRVA